MTTYLTTWTDVEARTAAIDVFSRLITGYFARRAARLERTRSRDTLMKLSDHMLEDIGVSRRDIDIRFG